MSDLKLGNIPVLSADKVQALLANMYVPVIRKGLPLRSLPSLCLWGQPGVGKSQSIFALAKTIEEETGKKCNVTDVRLILFNPVDLRGIPTANADKTLAVWLKPEIFQMDPSDKVINILFLDEISAAPQSVQAAAYQITLDRKIGEHHLPENTIVICAGNRVTDKSVAYQMPKALANRLMHLEMESDYDSWHRWAVESGVSPIVTGFLRFKADYLNTFDPKTSNLAFATPRSWEMVSNILNNVSSDFKIVGDLISGLVGVGIAHELKTYSRVFAKLPSVEDIFNGKSVTMPTAPDVLYALSSSMVAYCRAHKDNMTGISNVIHFINTMPPDFSAVAMKDLMYIEKDFKLKLLRNPEFKKWLNEKGALLSAANGC